MDDIKLFMENTRLREVGLDIEPELNEYDRRDKRMKTAIKIGAVTTAAGFILSRKHPKAGEAIMVAGLLPNLLFGLRNWSERERQVDIAADKITEAVGTITANYLELEAPIETAES